MSQLSYSCKLLAMLALHALDLLEETSTDGDLARVLSVLKRHVHKCTSSVSVDHSRDRPVDAKLSPDLVKDGFGKW